MPRLTRSTCSSQHRPPRFPVSSPSWPTFKTLRSATRGCSLIAPTLQSFCVKVLRHPSPASRRCCREEKSQGKNRDDFERSERARNPDPPSVQSGKGDPHDVVIRRHAGRGRRGNFRRGGCARRADRVSAGDAVRTLAPRQRRRERRGGGITTQRGAAGLTPPSRTPPRLISFMLAQGGQ